LQFQITRDWFPAVSVCNCAGPVLKREPPLRSLQVNLIQGKIVKALAAYKQT